MLDKKGACGQWRVRAFELTTSCLAYEEMRNGKRVRAEILLEVVGAVSIEGDDLVGRELVVTEVGAVRLHLMRASAEAGQPGLEAWASALRAAVGVPAAESLFSSSGKVSRRLS